MVGDDRLMVLGRHAAGPRPRGGRGAGCGGRRGRRDRPNCGYSLRMVLKQCGQVATMVEIRARRARPTGSPRSPRPASGRGTRCRRAVPGRRCRSRPCRARRTARRPAAAAGPWPARPCGCGRRRPRRTRSRAGPGPRRASPPSVAARKSVRHGVPRSAELARAHRPGPAPSTSRPLAQSSRADFGWPHGLPAFSMLRNAALSSFGKRLSSSTALRRISTMVSTCSISTGQPSTHQPQVVHCQTASSGMALSTSGRHSASSARLTGQCQRVLGGCRSPVRSTLPGPLRRCGRRQRRLRRPDLVAQPFHQVLRAQRLAGHRRRAELHAATAFGAGQRSSRCRQVRSLRPFAPKTGSSSPSSGSASRSIVRNAPRGSRLRK